LGHLWLWLDHKILNVALLRLRFCSIAATKSNPNLSAILPTLFVDRPLTLSLVPTTWVEMIEISFDIEAVIRYFQSVSQHV
jgi:hypothetical protein